VILYPAIDILDASAVRLVRGDFDRSTRYAADPLDAATAWQRAGAERLHVVDLDGARAGHPVNLEHVRRIAAGTGLPVQLGGGLRSLAALEQAAGAGADRLVLGTAAFTELLEPAVAAHGERLVVSVDVRGGRVSTAGWTETTELRAVEAIEELQRRGVVNFVYTDVDRDGMLGGLDVAEIARVADAVAAGGELLYSGGIGALADLEALAGLDHPRLAGVIVGKALYEDRFTIAEAAGALRCS
jgi:phosphoribosylformimino-5-aminoimidazole carboxamide ribotide isomerase